VRVAEDLTLAEAVDQIFLEEEKHEEAKSGGAEDWKAKA
jgi:hypothetical protein